jgi:hypothetical protein
LRHASSFWLLVLIRAFSVRFARSHWFSCDATGMDLGPAATPLPALIDGRD